MKNALIVGFGGQDGDYLADLLHAKQYGMHLLADRPPADQSIEYRREPAHQWIGDSSDPAFMRQVLRKSTPDEIYFLEEIPVGDGSADCLARNANAYAIRLARWLAEIRAIAPKARFVRIASGDVFGPDSKPPQDEQTPWKPRGPVAIAHACVHQLVSTYRDLLGLFACSAILGFRHSPRAEAGSLGGVISTGVAQVAMGQKRTMSIPADDLPRDVVYTADAMDALWRMANADDPRDHVVGTGELHTTRNMLESAFDHVGLPWDCHVTIEGLVGDDKGAVVFAANPSRLASRLGWAPSVTFRELMGMGVDEQVDRIRRRLRQERSRRAA